MNKFENFSSQKELITQERIKRLVNITKKSIGMMGSTKNGERLTKLFGIVARNILLLKKNGWLKETTLRDFKNGPIDNIAILNGLKRLETKYKIENS